MISHGGLTEICNDRTINSLGLSKEQFLRLPYEFQRALILGHIHMSQNQRTENATINQNINEKKKILLLFKKNR